MCDAGFPSLARLPNSLYPSAVARGRTEFAAETAMRLGSDLSLLPIVDHAKARDRALAAYKRIAMTTAD